MKRWFLFLLAGGLFCTVGCTASVKVIYPSRSYVTEKRHLGDVKTIMLVSSVDVEYYQAKGKPYAEIFASDNVLPEVLVEESGGTLTVGYKRSVSFRGENRCKVKVYAPSATVFETNASGDISIPGGLHTNRAVILHVNASGDIDLSSVVCQSLKAEVNASGDIQIQSVKCDRADGMVNASGDLNIKRLDCTRANLEVNASGDCEVEGCCRTVRLMNNASGDIDAENLRAVDVTAENNGSGDISCHAFESLDAVNRGSGDISYAGNPKQVRKEGKHIDRD